MSPIREVSRIIPRPAWITAIVLYLTAAALLLVFLPVRHDAGPGWPLWGKVLFSFGVPLVAPFVVLLTGYVFADAKRRGMRHVLWTFLVLFIPNAIGFILYFILREPLLTSCPNCQARTGSQYAFCPQCGTSLSSSCPECRRKIEPGWRHCPHCGASVDKRG
jgi:hypothetical protein